MGKQHNGCSANGLFLNLVSENQLWAIKLWYPVICYSHVTMDFSHVICWFRSRIHVTATAGWLLQRAVLCYQSVDVYFTVFCVLVFLVTCSHKKKVQRDVEYLNNCLLWSSESYLFVCLVGLVFPSILRTGELVKRY